MSNFTDTNGIKLNPITVWDSIRLFAANGHHELPMHKICNIQTHFCKRILTEVSIVSMLSSLPREKCTSSRVSSEGQQKVGTP